MANNKIEKQNELKKKGELFKNQKKKKLYKSVSVCLGSLIEKLINSVIMEAIYFTERVLFFFFHALIRINSFPFFSLFSSINAVHFLIKTFGFSHMFTIFWRPSLNWSSSTCVCACEYERVRTGSTRVGLKKKRTGSFVQAHAGELSLGLWLRLSFPFRNYPRKPYRYVLDFNPYMQPSRTNICILIKSPYIIIEREQRGLIAYTRCDANVFVE